MKQENTKAENAIKGLTPVALEKQVGNLVQMLTELNLEKQLGAAREVNLTDPYGTLHKSVVIFCTVARISIIIMIIMPNLSVGNLHKNKFTNLWGH